MAERDQEERETGRRALTLVLLSGGAGLLAGGVHLGVAGPPRLLQAPVMRTAGVMIAAPPPGGWGRAGPVTRPALVLAIEASALPPGLREGDVFQVFVASVDEAMVRRDVTDRARYTVLEEGVAQVDSAGLVRAVAPGEATLVVSYPDPDSGQVHTHGLAFTVAPANAPAPPIDRLRIDFAVESLSVGDVVQVVVRAGDGRDLTTRARLEASPPDLATVDAQGRLRVLAEGVLTLRAALDDPPLVTEGVYPVAAPAPGCEGAGGP